MARNVCFVVTVCLCVVVVTARFYNNYLSQNELVKGLVAEMHSENVDLHPSVIDVLNRVDRSDFVPKGTNAYVDSPITIGNDATISAPHMHAYALQFLLSGLQKPGANVLDIGCGSGYLSTLFAEIIDDDGVVIAIDYQSDLVQLSIDNTAKHFQSLLNANKIVYLTGDGNAGFTNDLYPNVALPKAVHSFDVIHVGAAAHGGIPAALLQQLANGGVLMIPVGNWGEQRIILATKDANGNISQTPSLGVRYVELKQNPKMAQTQPCAENERCIV